VRYSTNREAGWASSACAGLHKEYLAATGMRESLVAVACAWVEQRRPRGAVVAALRDGADWICEGYAKYLPHRIETLDFYYLSEWLAQIAAAGYPDDPVATQRWRETQERALLWWGPRQSPNELHGWEPKATPAREVRRKQLGYFENPQERMWDPTCLRLGLPMGTCAVEGACKHVIGDRFKEIGMHWKRYTVEPLLHVRATLLTDPTLDLRPYTVQPARALAA